MQLIPYLYSEFAKYHFEGTPPFRAMNLEPGFNPAAGHEETDANLSENPYLEAVNKEIKDQYMCGEYLLVAPLFTGQVTRKVVLPAGKWFDFYTGKPAGEGEVIEVSPGITKIPVYVKDGGIIPMMKPSLHAPGKGEKYDIEIRYYGSKPGIYRLYDDDGESYDYEKGLYSWREIIVTKETNGKFKTSFSKAEKGKPDNIGNVTWNFMSRD
jgi:alpha-glucosidase (family GH31 glycosyl hydrolase)